MSERDEQLAASYLERKAAEKRDVWKWWWLFVIVLMIIHVFFFSGCAGTVLYNREGFVAARIQGDATGLRVRSADGATLEAATLVHSVPTRAGGSVIGTTGTAVAGAAAALATALVP